MKKMLEIMEHEELRAKIENYTHMMSHHLQDTKPFQLLKSFYAQIDQAYENAIMRVEADGNKISCKKGCSLCCYGDVNVSQMEWNYIVAYKNKKKIKIDRKQLEKSYLSKKYLEQPCPFLSDHVCLIYDARPIACRTYNSMEEPEKCDKSNNQAHKEIQMPDIDLFHMALCRFEKQGKYYKPLEIPNIPKSIIERMFENPK